MGKFYLLCYTLFSKSPHIHDYLIERGAGESSFIVKQAKRDGQAAMQTPEQPAQPGART